MIGAQNCHVVLFSLRIHIEGYRLVSFCPANVRKIERRSLSPHNKLRG